MSVDLVPNKCFPLSKKYDLPCTPKPIDYAFKEQYSALMILSHYVMLGGEIQPLREHIKQAFCKEEKAEMKHLITIAGNPVKVTQFLQAKYPSAMDKTALENSVKKSFEKIRSGISTEMLNKFDSQVQRESKYSHIVITPYTSNAAEREWW